MLNGLTHNKNCFSKDYIKKISNEFGLYRNYILERHLWSYEFLSQIQQLSNKNCILKGGACTQIYLPIKEQRCTADIDILTNLNKNQIFEILNTIQQNLKSIGINTRFNEYIPLKGKDLPMLTYMFDLPFYYNPKKRKNNFLLKFDFLLTHDDLPFVYANNCATFGLNLNYTPQTISLYELISNKLTIFAVNSIGLSSFKIESFYKNIYDLYYLIKNFNDDNLYENLIPIIKTNISTEFSFRDLDIIPLNDILDDILKTLLFFSIIDLCSYNYNPERLRRFQKLYLQQKKRDTINNDIWSIMSMHIYLWTKSFKEFLNYKSYNNDLSLIFNEFNYFNTLNINKKNKYIENLKKLLSKKNKLIDTSSIKNPLRLIYLNYIA